MWQSVKLSHTIIRISLSLVFFWFGIDKFFHPLYWLNAWVPPWLVGAATVVHVAPSTVVYVTGTFEILVGISLASAMFVELFAFLAVLFLVAVSLFHGFNEVLVRDIGLMGALLALVFWPSTQFRKY